MKTWLRLLLVAVPMALLLACLLVAQQRHRQRERLLLNHYRVTGAKHFEAAEAAAAELRDMNRRASAWIAEVSNAVLTVLGEPLDPPPPPPPPATRPQARPPATRVPSKLPPARTTQDTPDGILTPEQLKARHTAREKQNDKDEAQAPEPAPAPAKPAPKPAAAPAEPRIKQLARTVIAAAENVHGDLGSAAVARGQALVERSRLLRAPDPVSAATPLSRLEALRREAEASLKHAREACAGAEEALNEIRAQCKTVEEARRERERLEQEARLAAEQRAREHRETQDLAELDQVTAEALRHYRFDDALDTLREAAGTFQTEAGREGHARLLERAQHLVRLRAFIIERINAQPLKWGWGSGYSARDIVGADANGIRYTGGSSSWAETPLEQVLKIVDNYIGDRNIPLADRAAYHLGAAVLCHVNGRMAITARYTAKVKMLMPSWSETVDAMVPPPR